METGQRSKNKVVLIGDFGVGKTTLFMRFKTGNYVENHGVKRDEAEHCKIWTKNGKERCVSVILLGPRKAYKPGHVRDRVLAARGGYGNYTNMWFAALY